LLFVGCDSETIPFSEGDMAPELVCFQWLEHRAGAEPQIATRRAGALEVIERYLRDDGVTLILHNASYDAAVWCREGLARLVFEAYRKGRIVCTWVNERLGEIGGFVSRKELSLGTCMKHHGLPEPSLKGTDLARGFAEFYDALEIPEPHRTYALEDCGVLKLFIRQAAKWGGRIPLTALQLLSYRDFALRMMSNVGIPIDGKAVDRLEAMCVAELQKLIPHALECGFIRYGRTSKTNPWRQSIMTEPDEDGRRQWLGWGEPAVEAPKSGKYYGMGLITTKKTIQKAVTEAYGGKPPMTEKTRKAGPSWKPQVSVAALTLAEAGDADLEAFARFGRWTKALANDVPMLQSSKLIHTRYGITETLRTLSGKPPIQNWSTKADGPQIRESVLAPPGFCIYSVDFSGLELASFAQNVYDRLGLRHMVDRLNTGVDLHSDVGRQIKGITYEEFLHLKATRPKSEWYRERQGGKGANFGFQGGMRNIEKFVRYCASNYDLWGPRRLSIRQGEMLYEAWKKASPDALAWLRYVHNQEKADGTFDVYLPGFGVTRKGAWFNAAANNPFQELGARVCSDATIWLAEQCFMPGEALNDCLSWGHVHDEWLVFVPSDKARLNEVDKHIRKGLFDVAKRTLTVVDSCVPEATASTRWSKGAKELRDDNGDLCVHEIVLTEAA
jgi:hypothetical protein